MKRAACILFAALWLAPGASGYHSSGYRWPVQTITYASDVSAYVWSADAAAYAWNTSGARVQFVRTAPAGAQVRIGVRWYKRFGGEAHVEHAGPRITSAFVGIQSGLDRYQVALVLAHELGHVLGLGHEDGVCATMNSVLIVDHESHCAPPPRGMWVCRLLRTDDVRGAVSLYGGTVRPFRGPEFCPR